MSDLLSDPIRRFRLVALLEAVGWAGLLLGIFLKYGPADTPLWVQIWGPIHGVFFIAYVTVTFLTWPIMRWGSRVGVVALLAGIPPFGTVVFERWATARGLLSAPAEDAAPLTDPALGD
ncbi:MAG TPA: DUF3817 domain-containing protein [Miltoncostaeaceae bacterium]|nr:DUF3817 domain-containing protein [Miltoncostaeaceae bacterium]